MDRRKRKKIEMCLALGGMPSGAYGSAFRAIQSAGGLVGGTFTFTEAAPASVAFRIDTIDDIPWYLDGVAVPSDQFSSVTKDVGRPIFIGVSNPNIETIQFNNSTSAVYTGVVFDLAILSALLSNSSIGMFISTICQSLENTFSVDIFISLQINPSRQSLAN